MRVLLTCKKRGWNGETANILDLARGCRDAGHAITVGARADSEMRRRALALSIPVLDLELEHRWSAARELVHDVRRLGRALRGLDLVHASASWDSWMVAFARRCARSTIPFLRTRHNLKAIRPHRMNRWLYRRSITCLVAASETIAADLRAQPWLDTRIATVRYGIDTDRFNPARHDRTAARSELRRRIGAAGDVPVVAYVSRVVPRKAPDLFVEAAARLAPRFPAARFLVAGAFGRETEWERRLRARIESLAPAVQALDFVEDVPALLRGCDVFVLPAPSEPFGLAPVEAMAMLCPPVCANAAGFAESIVHGETGLLFPPGDVDGCADAIATLLSDSELRARLGEAGRRRVIEQFSTRRMIAEYLALYEEMIRA